MSRYAPSKLKSDTGELGPFLEESESNSLEVPTWVMLGRAFIVLRRESL